MQTADLLSFPDNILWRFSQNKEAIWMKTHALFSDTKQEK